MIDDDQDLVLSHQDDIYRVLKTLQKEMRVLRIHFEGANEFYNSCLLEVDPIARQLVIDSLIPELGNNKALANQFFTISCHTDGIRIAWRHIQILNTTEIDGHIAFLLPYPTDVFYQQRRQHVRISPPQRSPVEITLRGENSGLCLHGTATDISVTGFGGWFSPEAISVLNYGQIFTECQLKQDDQILLTGSARVLHPRINDGHDKTLCGFEFHGLDPSQNRQLTRLILDIQRQKLRQQQALKAE